MSSMHPYPSKFDSVDSVRKYLLEPDLPEVVSSTTTSPVVGSIKTTTELKSTKRQKKEKELVDNMNFTHNNLEGNIQVLPSGRVRYGPITVNPRKQPSKTLYTGRRSKYEPLTGEEEQKRLTRRERNRTAATKCREKRETVLMSLETEYNNHLHHNTHLQQRIVHLQKQKELLQLRLSQHTNCSLQQMHSTPPPQQPSMIFHDTAVITSIMETTPVLQPLLPSHQLQPMQTNEEFSNFLQPTPVLLTNSAYTDLNPADYAFLDEQPTQQQQQQQPITMNSSLERLINSIASPTPPFVDNNNNFSGLFNSACGSSTCAQQHSSSSEDDSMPPVRKSSYVF
ncbi:unnamed protein product [Adineta steineri]|uniref:BZIP domain-containing protein n=1 Tax=Adineta steineri TaxID=433720 RepID=A0A818NVP7_9BILA|nr:unnamed protein product [Adineta steineri]